MARTTQIGDTRFLHTAEFVGQVTIDRPAGRVSVPMEDLLEFVGIFQKYESDLAMQKALVEEMERKSQWAKPAVMALHMAPLTGLDQKPETD